MMFVDGTADVVGGSVFVGAERWPRKSLASHFAGFKKPMPVLHLTKEVASMSACRLRGGAKDREFVAGSKHRSRRAWLPCVWEGSCGCSRVET